MRDELVVSNPCNSTVHLWFLPASEQSRRRLKAENSLVLRESERLAIAEARQAKVAERLVLSRILLRHALAFHIGCKPGELELEKCPSGRPVCKQANVAGVSFSISHAGAESVIAVSNRGEVGVDLEELRRAASVLEIAEAFFPAIEYHQIQGAHEPAASALQHWMLKESFVKALGLTVWDGLGRYRFDISNGRIRLFEHSSNEELLWNFAIGSYRTDYATAVALGSPEIFCEPISLKTHVLRI